MVEKTKTHKGGLAGFTKEQFRHWLKGQRAKPAVCGDALRCVLAQFLLDAGGLTSIEVDGMLYRGTRWDGTPVNGRLPAWGERVVEAFDAVQIPDPNEDGCTMNADGELLQPAQYRADVLRVL